MKTLEELTSDIQAQETIKETAKSMLTSPLAAFKVAAQKIIDSANKDIEKANKAIAKLATLSVKLGDGEYAREGQVVFSPVRNHDGSTVCYDASGHFVPLRIVSKEIGMVKVDSRDNETGYLYFGTIRQGERAATIGDVAADTNSKAKRYVSTVWFATREAAVESGLNIQRQKVAELKAAYELASNLLEDAEIQEPIDIETTANVTVALSVVA